MVYKEKGCNPLLNYAFDKESDFKTGVTGHTIYNSKPETPELRQAAPVMSSELRVFRSES